MNQLDRLTAIEEVKRLKASYCRYLDTKDWKHLAACFTEDGVFDHGGEQGAVQGRTEIVAFLSAQVGDVQLVHHALMPEIEITAADSATAIWGLEDRLLWPDGRRSLHAYGHYHESYEKVDGQWKISLSQVSQLRVDTAVMSSSDWKMPSSD